MTAPKHPTMQLVAFRKSARKLMNDFGFAHIPFKWDAAPTRAGAVTYVKRNGQWVPLHLSMSRKIAMRATPEAADDTLRHEIAHLIAGQAAGHGPAWEAACAITGAMPKACYSAHEHFAAQYGDSVEAILGKAAQ